MKKVIINADDFGASYAVNVGIIKAYKEGILTSTTTMANMPQFEHAMQLAKENPGLGVGVHLNIIDGKPLAVSEELSRTFAVKAILGRIPRRVIEEELRAQVERTQKYVDVTHLDTHQHMGVFPNIREAVLNTAIECGIKKIRVPRESFFSLTSSLSTQFLKSQLIARFIPKTKKLYQRNGIIFPQQFFGILSTGTFSLPYLEAYLGRTKTSAEIMVHPGETGESNLKGDFLSGAREHELQALCSQRAKELFDKYQVERISYESL